MTIAERREKHRIGELWQGEGGLSLEEDSFLVPGYRYYKGKEGSERSGEKLQINVLALGDVGGILALALKLMAGDILHTIGICDLSGETVARYEAELNQIAMPLDFDAFPRVVPVEGSSLFDGDVVAFCATKGVPPVEDGSSADEVVDVRMVQLEENKELIGRYARQAVEAGYEGEFFVVSDPVDPLCMAAVNAGMAPTRVQGFGLGVMNGRAAYYARKNPELSRYLQEGRVFGPHGEDLVVADSVSDYDDEASKRLTSLTVEANQKVRALGFKPYMAPAVTSGAIAIAENLRGNWHYSSAWFGDGAFLGMRNRRRPEGLEIENLPLDDRLFGRIRRAYEHLQQLSIEGKR